MGNQSNVIEKSESFINIGGERIEDFRKKQTCLIKPEGNFIAVWNVFISFAIVRVSRSLFTH
jgi:hypothetical protein